MEHYITEIKINKLRHLSNINISLNSDERQHLIITGKNGSGKTTLLLAIQKYLKAINDGKLNDLINNYMLWFTKLEKNLDMASTDIDKYEAEKKYKDALDFIKVYKDGIDILFNDIEKLEVLYSKGDFITAFFPANRKTRIISSHGVSDIRLQTAYDITSNPGELLLKYMIHLKTQQSYARNEGDTINADRIQKWFDRFTEALRILLDDNTVSLEYNYREYDFKIHEDGREPFGFKELSDGYSSVINIVSDLILRMDKNWLLGNGLSEYNIEGIVLIDELETHLHIELQKKIFPFLVKFFPRIQFIITTHSPYILNSISNAKAYDLEKCVELENLSVYSSDELAEAYFDVDEYSEELKRKIDRYRCLVEKELLTEEEHAERAKLRIDLKKIPYGLSGEAREMFYEIEGRGL